MVIATNSNTGMNIRDGVSLVSGCGFVFMVESPMLSNSIFKQHADTIDLKD
jgi:hypothetical protein